MEGWFDKNERPDQIRMIDSKVKGCDPTTAPPYNGRRGSVELDKYGSGIFPC